MLAFRLVEVKSMTEGVERHLGAPLVGREQELGFLVDAFERCVAKKKYAIVVVAGDAGVGKSRLIAEARSCHRSTMSSVSASLDPVANLKSTDATA
jgi:hypothetical protein